MGEYQFEFSNNGVVKIFIGVVLMYLLLNLILPCFGKILRYRYHQNLNIFKLHKVFFLHALYSKMYFCGLTKMSESVTSPFTVKIFSRQS